MENNQKNTLYNVLIFITWTVTSFLCHQSGTLFLKGWANGESTENKEQRAANETFEQLISAGLLTGCQLVFCIFLVSLDETGSMSKSGNRMAKLTHAVATFATNFSMSLMASSSTFAIKMMEPVTSALVQYILLGTTINTLTALSLPFIVGGAIAFVGNPLAIAGTALGVSVAFVSNILLALRVKFTDKSVILPMAAAIMVSSISLCLESYNILHTNFTHIIVCALVSGTFHVVYSYVSTALVLTQISVVSHAVANIMKRLLVVLLLYTFGKRIASVWNFIGLLVCTAGLLVYAWDKSTSNSKGYPRMSPTKKMSLVGIFVVGFLAIILLKQAHVTPCKGTSPAISKLDGPMLFTRQYNHSYKYFNAFQPGAFQKPSNSHLLPNLDGLSERMSQEFLQFLRTPIQNETHANFLSEKLSTSTEIIKETQRLHFNIIGKEVSKFKYAFLIDFANFENKGDPAITVGEIYFLARMNIEIVFYCHAGTCKLDVLKSARELAENYDPKELVILVHGGGNIVGYAAADIVRFNVIELFPSYQIIVFPQSIWIRNWNQGHVHNTVKRYCCNSNLTIILRDALSYSIAKKLYNGTTRLIMAPDMAFQIGHIPRFMSPVFDVMWIKRKDGETPGYEPPKNVPKNIKVHISDWWKWTTPPAGCPLEKAFYVATNGLFYLQRGRVVITDRLHGHILSVLMDIPHVLIDNKAKKLSAYHNTWTRSLNNTVITDDPKKALGLAIELLRKYNDILPPVVPFLSLGSSFSKIINNAPERTYV